MAFTATTIDNASNIKGRGVKVDGYSGEIFAYAKLTGDTTGTVTAVNLKRIISVYVFNSDGVAIAAVPTITNGATASVALATLGAGTAGVILLKGSKR